jgi:hypothetical protein
MRRQYQPHWEPEPQLAVHEATRLTQSWLCTAAQTTTTLDVRRWQKRAARGLSWNRNGLGAERRKSH